MNLDFPVGRRFSSWEEVQECKNIWRRKHLYIFMPGTQKNLNEGQRKHVPKHINNANFDLKYYNLKLCCCSEARTISPEEMVNVKKSKYFSLKNYGYKCFINVCSVNTSKASC